MRERLMEIARAVADRLSHDEGMRALFVGGSLGARGRRTRGPISTSWR